MPALFYVLIVISKSW